MARKPITWGTALARVIIIMNESSTQASAMPSVLCTMDEDSLAIGSARLKANTTNRMPSGMVVGILISVSTSHLTLSLSISRCNRIGMTITLVTSVIAAEEER